MYHDKLNLTSHVSIALGTVEPELFELSNSLRLGDQIGTRINFELIGDIEIVDIDLFIN